MTTKLLNTKEAALYFGVSESTIRRWQRANILPYIRIGNGRGRNRTIRFRLEDLRAVAEAHLEGSNPNQPRVSDAESS